MKCSYKFVAAGLRPLFSGDWPARHLWVCAVRLDNGRRVTFGLDPVRADVATAVAASCAIPGFFEPVTIDGARYVDGGAHSPTNADLVARLGLDLVVVSTSAATVGEDRRGHRRTVDDIIENLFIAPLGNSRARKHSEPEGSRQSATRETP